MHCQRSRPLRVCTIAAVSAFSLAGCGGNPFKDTAGNPSAAAEASRQFGLLPLYPFRQDVWIGDVYISNVDYTTWKAMVQRGETPPLPYRVTRLDVTQAIMEFQKITPQFKSDTPVKKEGRAYEIGTFKGYLYPAAAPALSVGKSRSVSAGAAGNLIDLIKVKLGGAYQSEARFAVSASDLMSTGLPAYYEHAWNVWAEAFGTNGGDSVFNAKATELRSLCTRGEGHPPPDPCTLNGVLMTEIFFTKKLTIDSTSASGFNVAGSASASLGTKQLLNGATDAVTGAVDSAVTDIRKAVRGVASEDNIPEPAVQKLLDRVDAITGKTTASTTGTLNNLAKNLVDVIPNVVIPGMGDVDAQFSYASADRKSAQLIATFDEPVAIGYRGISFQLTISGKTVTVAGGGSTADIAPVSATRTAPTPSGN